MDSLSTSSIMSGNHASSSVVRTETIASEDGLCQLPEEIIQHIFGYLNRRELGLNSLVSRRWHRLSSDPNLLNAAFTITFPSLSILDASRWAKCFGELSRHGLSVADEPPINPRTSIPILEQFSSLPIKKLTEENEEGERIEKDAGITLLTIPKGLTFNKLVKMAQENDKVKFNPLRKSVRKFDIGDVEVDKTSRLLITNNVLEGSRDLSFEEQGKLEESFKCERPDALAALALVVTTFINSGKRLYIDDVVFTQTDVNFVDTDGTVLPWVQPGPYMAVVGNFGSDGLNVDSKYVGYSDRHGVVALRKL
jgi:hypothetical protein